MPPRKPQKPTTITIAIVGDGITPKDVSIRQLANLLEATAATFEAIAADGNTDPPKLSLSRVKQGSAAYDLRADAPGAHRVMTSFVATARKRGKDSSPRTRSALGRLQKVAAHAGAALRIDPLEGQKTKPVILAAPIPEDDTQIEEGTVVHGRLVGLKLDARDKATITIRYDDGGHGDFAASAELMTEAAPLLGAHVLARVTFLRGEQDWEGEIESIEERPEEQDFMSLIREARQKLQDRDVVVDARAWLTENDEQ